MARLARIHVYPVKSLDPQLLREVVVLASGALANDRRFALVDRQGQVVNAKRTPEAHRLRSSFDPLLRRLSLHVEGTRESLMFDVDTDRPRLAQWLSDFFGIALEIAEDAAAGFPDDTESPGPTVISTATIQEVASWFAGLDADEVRRRFRANLEIDGVEPFWEDRLVSDEGHVVRFQIGAAELWGTNPCQRCPVPTRNSRTGEATRDFARIFARRREESLPDWAPASRFGHFYRLATNTRGADSQERTIRVGDEVRVLGIS
jgi:uncharacterized protein